MDDFQPYGMPPAPTAMRPLLGLTILVVEDSRYASDALRQMCLHSGARIRRADCLASARRHLAIYRPSVALVDMGLPDGSGADLIAEMAEMSPHITTILGTSADNFAEQIAIAAGADGFLLKPHDSLAAFQQAILSHVPKDRQPDQPRALRKTPIEADMISYRDDLHHVAKLLSDPLDDKSLTYVTQFLTGIAQQAHDTALASASARLGMDRLDPARLRHLLDLVQDRIETVPSI